MAQAALRWTKHALNHWYRAAGPGFDASLAYGLSGLMPGCCGRASVAP